MINRILPGIDHRYLAFRERAEIESYLLTVRQRRLALAELRGRTSVIADVVVSELKRRYPEFTRNRPQGFEKGRRDIALLTAFAGNAMFLGETESMDEQFTHWYRSILRSVHLSPGFMGDTFDAWLAGLRNELSDEAFILLMPAVKHLVGILSDLPAPVRNEDGQRLETIQ